MSRALRALYHDHRRAILLGYLLVVFVIGLVGWFRTEPGISVLDAVYATLLLFVLEFSPDREPSVLLQIARFAAPLASLGAVGAVVLQVVSSQRVLSRASRLRGHVLILGSGPEAAPLGARLRAAGGDVVMVAELPPVDVEIVARSGVLLLSGLDERDLARVAEGAERVLVVEARDVDAAATARRARRAAPAGATVTVVFTDPDLAAQWQRGGDDDAVARPTRVAATVLREVPPYPADAVVPPPVVIGDGPAATEIVRVIATGWQEPGEARTIECLGSDDSWVEAAETDAQGRATLRFHRLGPRAGRAAPLLRSVLAEWPLPQKAERYEIRGPRVYVTYDDDARTLPIAAALASGLPDATVVAVVDDGAVWAEHRLPVNLRVFASQDVLADPAVYRESVHELLAHELATDAARWPSEEPTALGDPEADPDGVGAHARAVAAAAEGVLGSVGIELHRGAVGEVVAVVLSPEELIVVARALGEVLGLSMGTPEVISSGVERVADGVERPVVTVDAVRLRLIELAARLPVLVARTGVTPVRTSGGELFTAGQVERLARLVHAGYLTTADATQNATGSANADLEWDILSETDRLANVAQVLDMPVKLAMLGLGMRPVDPGTSADEFVFTVEQVELLAEVEHRRWEHFQLRNGRRGNEWNVPWADLDDGVKQYDRDPVTGIPRALATAGWEIAVHEDR